MRLGAELFCTNCVHVDPLSFIEMFLLLRGKILLASRGRDEFQHHVHFEPRSRLAATGRLSVFQKSPLLFHNQARPAWLVQTEDFSVLKDVAVGLRSNLFMDSTFLMNNFSLTVIASSPDITWSGELNHPKLELQWLSKGTYLAELPEGWWLAIR